MNEKRLFIASCVALIATAMSFAIRGDIMSDFETVHVKPYVTAQGEANGAGAGEEQKGDLDFRTARTQHEDEEPDHRYR